ncbi:MAG: hypothetical protein HQL87_12735 [Magnetococcales bacterium]|nr:hypothetical protein [Magnetococcales bacterium]
MRRRLWPGRCDHGPGGRDDLVQADAEADATHGPGGRDDLVQAEADATMAQAYTTTAQADAIIRPVCERIAPRQTQ